MDEAAAEIDDRPENFNPLEEGSLLNADTTYIETDFFGNVSVVRSFIRQSFVRLADFLAIGKIAPPTSTEKQRNTPLYSSNDAECHEDQFCPRIVKIGAILGHFWPVQSFF